MFHHHGMNHVEDLVREVNQALRDTLKHVVDTLEQTFTQSLVVLLDEGDNWRHQQRQERLDIFD